MLLVSGSLKTLSIESFYFSMQLIEKALENKIDTQNLDRLEDNCYFWIPKVKQEHSAV